MAFNLAVTNFINDLAALCNDHAPKKEVTLNSKTDAVPWLNREIDILQNLKDNALARVRDFKCKSTDAALKSISNRLKNARHKSKRKYYTTKIQEQSSDPRRLWTILKEVSHTQEVRDDVTPDVVDWCAVNSFNTYFA